MNRQFLLIFLENLPIEEGIGYLMLNMIRNQYLEVRENYVFY
jgi:hypothetical protein